MRFLELRIPPPIVAFFFAGVAWAVARATPALALPLPLRTGVAIALALAGVGFVVAGVRAFRHAATTIHPLKPEKASAIVSSGVFGISRNPMYVGLVLVLVAWAVFLSSPAALVGPVGLALYLTRFQIVPEERALATKFGDAYADYTARVRRWI